ncbi:MAG: hypothetical protein KDD51_04175 [Bdellovibrionales bacterium]|nr:hypothetical protein [Bdellovibrionales bacterium]
MSNANFKASPISRRRHTRFNPDYLTVAWIELGESEEDFKPQMAAIVINQSYRGAALGVRPHDAIRVGQKCFVKVGELAPLRAEIVWIKGEDPELIKIGVNFLD